MSDVTKVTVNLPTSVVEELKSIASANGTTMTEALRQSILLNRYVTEQEKLNNKLLIELPSGQLRQVIRR